tara:strand:+ start:5312 stop:5593 length:282 start_codon:yes stop_codon:yes gene_type:complete
VAAPGIEFSKKGGWQSCLVILRPAATAQVLGTCGEGTQIWGLYPSEKDQSHNDDKNHAKQANAGMTEAISITTKASTKATKQEYNDENDKNCA